MKIIEAMRRVKINKEKISDLQTKIGQHCANLNYETKLYGADTAATVRGWLQTCLDLSQDNAKLLTAISETNHGTFVTIALGDKAVTKSIAEWIWRRREYAAIDFQTWSKLTDRGLKEGSTQSSTTVPFEVKIERHFDPEERDRMLTMFRSEPHEIDSALEVINATTDIIE